MNVDPIAIAGALVLTVLAVLLTGPGMWSEKWGWGFFRSRQRSGRTPAGAAGERAAGPADRET